MEAFNFGMGGLITNLMDTYFGANAERVKGALAIQDAEIVRESTAPFHAEDAAAIASEALTDDDFTDEDEDDDEERSWAEDDEDETRDNPFEEDDYRRQCEGEYLQMVRGYL